jgi:hypothetical protein
MADLCLVFKEASILFFKVVVLAYIPTSSHMRFHFPPHPLKHLLLVVFLMMAILTGVRWNLSVVLICISFMARDGEHFFICFLVIWSFSFEKVLFSSVAHLLIGSLIWGDLGFF